jgi:glycine/D-amino acid oxidase-like deaminating enzyme
MAFYDIFNGDADGLCALHQLRLAEPRAAQLVTGTKREIRLVERVEARAGDELTVLDIAFDVNRAAVKKALQAGARVRYFDHHFAGDVPQDAALEAFIDTAADICTSLIVDRELNGRYRAWAVVAAFGDNLAQRARQAAAPLGVAPHALAQLQELGECLNYNGYGESVADLHYHPIDLYRAMAPYEDPLAFVADEPVFDVLREGMQDDLYRASETRAQYEDAHHALVILPNAAWSRRVGGTLGNRLAQLHPGRAHAVLTEKPDGYLVSVRAPLERPRGADTFCRQFETGGGRAAAAGINTLPAEQLERFARAFRAAFLDAS